MTKIFENMNTVLYNAKNRCFLAIKLSYLNNYLKNYDLNVVYMKYCDKAAKVTVMHHLRSQRKMTTCSRSTSGKTLAALRLKQLLLLCLLVH